MNDLVKLASKLNIKYKIANDELVPDTIREPQAFEPEAPALGKADKPTQEVLEFMDLLHNLAGLKNTLVQVQDKLNPSVGLIVREIINLRPGVLRNALKDSIGQGTFSNKDYISLRDNVSVNISSMNLVTQLQHLFSMVKESVDNGRLNPLEGQSLLPKIRNVMLAVINFTS